MPRCVAAWVRGNPRVCDCTPSTTHRDLEGGEGGKAAAARGGLQHFVQAAVVLLCLVALPIPDSAVILAAGICDAGAVVGSSCALRPAWCGRNTRGAESRAGRCAVMMHFLLISGPAERSAGRGIGVAAHLCAQF